MFENLFTNLKAKTVQVSNALTYDNLKSKTNSLHNNFDSLKSKLATNSNKVTNYLTIRSKYNCNDDNGQYLSPRAYTKHNEHIKTEDLNWPICIENQGMDCQNNPLFGLENGFNSDGDDIVNRFIKVITVNNDEDYDFKNRRRTDREEIRRRLAMGSESDDYYTPGDRPGRKPSLQARLQSGMNLQICFMNETVSDSDSPNSDTETPSTISTPAHQVTTNGSHSPPYTSKMTPMGASKRLPKPNIIPNGQRPQSLPLSQTTDIMSNNLQAMSEPMTEANFFARQARLQIEARMALAQAKEMAHMQMEVERQRQKKSPITEMVRSSLEKVGIQFPEERRRVSRQILTEMNIAQLQVIVNDLHTQIESLNEGLVRFLMERDDLHMEQDSMLVDIEDLTRYLGAKEQSIKDQQTKLVTPQVNNNNSPPSSLTAISSSVKPRLHRIASLVKK